MATPPNVLVALNSVNVSSLIQQLSKANSAFSTLLKIEKKTVETCRN